MAIYPIQNLDALISLLNKEGFSERDVFGEDGGIYDSKRNEPSGLIARNPVRIIAIAGRRLEEFMKGYQEFLTST